MVSLNETSNMKSLFAVTILGNMFSVHYFGVFLFVALLVFLGVIHFELKKRSISEKRTIDNILVLLLIGLVGGRVLFVLLNASYYAENISEISRFWYGGFYFEGAFLAALVYVVAWLSREHKKRVFGWLDALIIASLPAQAFAKIGVYLTERDLGFMGIQNVSIFSSPMSHLLESSIYILSYATVVILFYGYAKDLKDGVLFYSILIMLSVVHVLFTPRFGQVSLFSIGDYVVLPSHFIFLFILTGAASGLIIHIGAVKNN